MGRKNKKESTRISIRESIADSVNLSKEIILDVTRMIFIGNCEVTIENYKGITEYTSEKIILEAKPYRIKIEGLKLEVKSITDEMLYITGEIHSLQYLREG